MASVYEPQSPFVHLHVHSEFSFLQGASHVETLVRAAVKDGQTALAITDTNNLCCAPQFLDLAKRTGIKPIFGSVITLETGNIVALVKSRDGYASLCRLLTFAHLDQERGKPMLTEEKLFEYAADLIVLSGSLSSPLQRLLLQGKEDEANKWIWRFSDRFYPDFYIELQRTREYGQERLLKKLVSLATINHIPIVATNDVHYQSSALAQAQDLLTCLRHKITVDQPHVDRKINSELSLLPQRNMTKKFRDLPEAIENTLRIAEQCEAYAIHGKRFTPKLTKGVRKESSRILRDLTIAGAKWRYGEIVPDLQNRIDYELSVINELNFSDYFLIVNDLVEFARQKGIQHAGRGSAADSVVAYCLDITKVDSYKRNLRFERFISPERKESLPDIDIDFDARYRDDVTDYVTNLYGKDHVATISTFARYRGRSAIRDVAKTLGFSVEDIDRIAKSTHWATSAKGLRRAIEKRPELRALKISEKKFGLLFDLCRDIDNLPRHLSTHSCGVVITGDPIWMIAPLQMAAKGVHVIQYDKDGVEDLRLFKLDLLCLRMLGAVKDSVAMVKTKDASFEYDKIDCDDPETFEMIQSGNTAGAFQIESPAQMSLHPRLKTRTYEDVVASVALIRPGPIKGEMVEPFILHRNGMGTTRPIHPIVDEILSHTYGVVLYQEQVISIAIQLAGFSPGQADLLRRAISHDRSPDRMREIGEEFVAQAISNGVEAEVATTVFSWLEGYAGYGFCEAHAAAFGDTAIRTAHLLRHYPAEFYAALLNNQPMGFYSAATIVNEARIRGIQVLSPDVQTSEKEFTVRGKAILVGLKQVKGIQEPEIEEIIKNRPYSSWGDFLARTRLPRDLLENLVLSGACSSFHSNRRVLLFSLGTTLHVEAGSMALPLNLEPVLKPQTDFSDYDLMSHEWDVLGFSPWCHPLEFWRDQLAKSGVLPNNIIRAETDKDRVFCAAGWVIRPHTPPTKSGKTVVFFTLEDETGLMNITTFPDMYERFGHLIFGNPLLIIEGKKDRRGANSLIVQRIRKFDERPVSMVLKKVTKPQGLH
jgi:error-prone DNA polymerase